MFKQVRLHDAILKFYQRSQPIAFSNAETLYDDLVLLRDQILMYGDLSEAQTNYLNDFIEKFDGTLSNTVKSIFEKWLSEGFLVDFIRDIINEEVVVARDGESKLNLRLIRDKQELTAQLGQIAMSVLNFGAVGDGVHDDRPAIQAGIDYLNSLGGGTLLFPKGYTFLLNSRTNASLGRVLILKSQVSLTGEGELLIASGFGDYHSLFSSNAVIENVTISNLTINENTVNNPMVNIPHDSNNHRVTFFAWSRNSRNLTIENVTINDCLGVWQITTGKVFNLRVKNNTINFSEITPIITYDRTSLYMGAEGGEVSGNTLNGSFFANTAIELHGTNLKVFNNRVDNYNSFMFIVNDSEVVDHIELLHVYNNNVTNCNTGIVLWFESDNADVDDVLIHDNYLNIEKSALRTFAYSGSNVVVNNVDFYNNTVYTSDTQDITFSFISPVSLAHVGVHYRKISIRNNNIYSNSRLLLTFEKEPVNPNYFKIDNFYFTDNRVVSVRESTLTTLIRILSWDGNFKNINIKRNEFDLNHVVSSFIGSFRLDPLQHVYFEDNIFTGSEPTDLVPLVLTNESITVKQLRPSLTMPYKDSLAKRPVRDGTLYYDHSGGRLSKSEGTWYVSKIVHTFKNEYVPLGVVFEADGTIHKITKEGYVASHPVSEGGHRVGDYVSYGGYVAEVLKDNNYTSQNNEGGFNTEYFKYLGDKATIVEL